MEAEGGVLRWIESLRVCGDFIESRPYIAGAGPIAADALAHR